MALAIFALGMLLGTVLAYSTIVLTEAYGATRASRITNTALILVMLLAGGAFYLWL